MRGCRRNNALLTGLIDAEAGVSTRYQLKVNILPWSLGSRQTDVQPISSEKKREPSDKRAKR
jgi:hypothetical protein